MEEKNVNKLPLLSVIIPVYNAEQYLKQCLESVINQTYQNLEIILVDDGSTDGSLNLCNYYASQDKRIKVIIKEHGGMVQARKAGVVHAKGKYLTYVDADDWVDLNTYERIVDEISKKEADLLLYGLIEEYEDMSNEVLNKLPEGYYQGEEIKEKIYPYMLCNKMFFQFGILPNLVCKVVRRELLKTTQVLVNDNVEIGEDADCTFQMILKAQTLQIIEYTPYHYRKRYDSTLWKKMNLLQYRSLYNDLKTAFGQNERKEILMPQLYQYMLFIMLLKSTESFISYEPFRKFFANKKIILYGAGGFGQEIYRVVSQTGIGKIDLWVDRRYQVYQEMGMKVQGIDAIFYSDYDEIFVAVLNTEQCEKIEKFLMEKGVSDEKIKYILPSKKYISMLLEILETRK